MKSIFVLSLLVIINLSSHAQLWQLSGYTKEYSGKHICISVSDQNGKAVTGLKSSNFEIMGESTDPSGIIDYVKCEIVMKNNISTFREVAQGLYIMMVQFPGVYSGTTIGQHVFFKSVFYISR